MIFKKLSDRELELVKNRGCKSVVEVLGLHKEISSGLKDKKLDSQTTIQEVLINEV